MGKYANQSQLLSQTGPTVRPLQGLPPNNHGSSRPLVSGDTKKTLIDVRSETNDVEMLAVSIGRVLNGAPPPGFEAIDLSVTVTWGAGGANFEAEIDILNGTVFSIPANYLKVDANYAPGGLSAFQVSAGVGYGTVRSRTQRTILLATDLAPAGVVTIVPPPFATSFVVFAGSPAVVIPPFVRIDFITAGGTVMATYRMSDFTNTSFLNPETFPVLNTGQDFIQLTNLTGIVLKNIGVIFRISL